MKELHLFAGAGGGILGGLALGHACIGAVEIEPYCQAVLRQRQVDGVLPSFPIFGDIKEFNGYEFKEKYGTPDIICGGFPCQDISSAGKGAGIDGERSGLWSEMARVIGEIRPDYCLLENSPMLVGRGLARVLGDLASMRYDACWRIIGADDLGAPHVRKRIWILARRQDIADVDGLLDAPNTPCERLQARGEPRRHEAEISVSTHPTSERCSKLELSHGSGAEGEEQICSTGQQLIDGDAPGWWSVEPNVVRMVYGVPKRVDRIKALGNAQVPAVAAFAFRYLIGVFENYDKESMEREGE